MSINSGQDGSKWRRATLAVAVAAAMSVVATVANAGECPADKKVADRLHAKTAFIDRSTVFIGSMNLDPRSASKNTELGIIVESPQLAKEVIRVIHISKLQSAYRLRFARDGQSLEWLTMADEGDVVLSEEPDVTPFMRLQNMLLAPFVPEQQL